MSRRNVPTAVEAARDALAASPGAPVWLDVPLIATWQPRVSRQSDLVVKLTGEGGDDLGTAHVFTREWFPGAMETRFSHYFQALARCFEGLELLWCEPSLSSSE